MRRARPLVVVAVMAMPLAWLACKDSSPPPALPITAAMDGGPDVRHDVTAPSMAEIDAMVHEAAAARPPEPDFYACAGDADCVAVPKNGCCFNGYMEAVNKTSVDAYKASFVCPHPNQMCPHYRVVDKRQPRCNGQTHHCEMVDTKP